MPIFTQIEHGMWNYGCNLFYPFTGPTFTKINNFYGQFSHRALYKSDGKAENRAKFHSHSYVIMTPTSQIVMKLSIY